MTQGDFIWRFTPSRTDPELLEAIFVQREELLVDLLERVRESATTKNKHHVLLVGQRGIGKTHLLSLLDHRVRQDTKLSKRLRIAWLHEEETTTSFIQLLKRIYETLSKTYPDEFPREWLQKLLGSEPDAIRKQLEERLLKAFTKRSLLLMVENLDLLCQGLGSEGQKKWRAFLQEHPMTCLVATSQRLSKAISKRDEPFFGFFATTHLKPLLPEDAVQLLANIAQEHQDTSLVEFLNTPEGRSRVRAVHHLAGGNHRVYIVLSNFVTSESLDQLVEPFEKMADDLTPYYQERLRWLSPQQRQIVELLSSRETALTPKQIAQELLAGETTVAGQLKKLLELGYVLKNPRGREVLYDLSEPLMRLATEVKEKRNQPLRLLVRFLRAWYQPSRLQRFLDGTCAPQLRIHVEAALSDNSPTSDPRLVAIRLALEEARANGQVDEELLILEEKAHTTNAVDDWFEFGYWLYERKGRYQEAVDAYDRSLRIDPEYAFAWNNKGNSLNGLQRYEDAIECYDRALKIDPEYAFAWNNKGNSLNGLHRSEEAIECLDRALKIDPEDAYVWNNKGSSLNSLQRYEDAIECYDRALKIDPEYAYAWGNKGNSLNSLQRYEEAIECYDRVLEIDPKFAFAALNRSEPLMGLRRWNEAFRGLNDALERFPGCSGDVRSMIRLIHEKSEGVEQLCAHVLTFVELYEQSNHLDELGSGLVHHLADINVEMLSAKALDAWRDAWLEAGQAQKELSVSLRIFRLGIEYLKTQDKRVLLDLIQPEREVAYQALGLNDEEIPS